MKSLLTALALTGLVMMTGCRTVPLTGRSQFILTSVETEKAMGMSAFNEYKSKLPRSVNATYNAAMGNCARALIKATQYKEYDWEYTVFQSKTQNAFCLPGGKIAVYTGIMDIMNNEAELAFVVAHEIAHALARHSGEQMAWGAVQSMGVSVLKESGYGSAFESASEYGVMLPFSRKHEYEADQMGLLLMAKAGYNPRAAIEFWSRFTAGSASSSLNGWMSTHPADADRIQAMRQHLPAAEAEYARATSKKGYGMSI